MGFIAEAIAKNKPTSLINSDDLGWHKIGEGGTYKEFKSNDYENAYPSISRITNQFMKIRPYTVNDRGEPVDSNLKNVLYHPNKKNSSVEFREALALMYLVHPKTHILVWTRVAGAVIPGEKITPNNIGGFTIMENPSVITVNGETTYTLTNDQGSRKFSDSEVVTLKGLNPYAINSGGYSPTKAVAKWTTIDDYIAQYQKGFFENGAVPTGEFIITASTVQEFRDIVDTMQARHRGAGRNGNVTYTHRPIDQTTGKPANAQIEWVPFATPNRELSLKELFEQANKKIDSVYGVPASVRGVGENNNYATARTDQQNFMENVVDPITLKIWTQFTHELNRITGGLGVAISYDIEIPALADEEKVKEETGEIRDRRFTALKDKGYSTESIKKYFETGDLSNLEETSTKDEVDNDDPDVDGGDEVKDSPDPRRVTDAKKKVENRLTTTQEDDFEQELAEVVREHMSKQIEKYIDSLDATSAEGDTDEEDTEEFTDDMMVVIIAVMIVAGTIQYDEGKSLLVAAGISTANLTQFALKDVQISAYRDYLETVAKSYGEDTGKAIRNVLARAEVEEWDRAILVRNLRNIMNTDEWRVARLATSEINLSQSKGSLHAMEQIQDEADVEFNKVWTHTGSDQPCEFCQTLIDTKVALDEDFVKDGEAVTGDEGGIFINTWRDIDSGGLHANCHCLQTFEVER